MGRVLGRRATVTLGALVLATLLTTATLVEAMGPLHEAALTGNTDVVRSWIARKRSLDVTYDEPSRGLEGNYARARGITALMVAAQVGRLEIATLLVEGGANLYAESRLRDGSDPRTAFDYAVTAGHLAIAEYLWTRSDGVRLAGRLDRHIFEACGRGCDDRFGTDARTNMALFLIGITRDERALGKGLGDAACFAAQPRRLLDFLARHRVPVPRNTLHCIAYNHTIREIRPVQDRLAVATFFLDRGADPNDFPAPPLRGAAAAHDVEMVTLLLARGADPNLTAPDGMTPIAAAANSCVHGDIPAQAEPRQRSQLAVIERLVGAGAQTRLPTGGSAPAQLRLLKDCCARQPQTPTQRRICETFGL